MDLFRSAVSCLGQSERHGVRLSDLPFSPRTRSFRIVYFERLRWILITGVDFMGLVFQRTRILIPAGVWDGRWERNAWAWPRPVDIVAQSRVHQQKQCIEFHQPDRTAPHKDGRVLAISDATGDSRSACLLRQSLPFGFGPAFVNLQSPKARPKVSTPLVSCLSIVFPQCFHGTFSCPATWGPDSVGSGESGYTCAHTQRNHLSRRDTMCISFASILMTLHVHAVNLWMRLDRKSVV